MFGLRHYTPEKRMTETSRIDLTDRATGRTNVHLRGYYGDDGENEGVLAISAVLDPGDLFPACGRIVVGGPTRSPLIDGYIARLCGFSCSPDAADALADELKRAAADARFVAAGVATSAAPPPRTGHTVDMTDADLDEVIGDGSCTHLPHVRLALELRRRRNEKSADRALIVGLVTTAVLRARTLPDEAESIAARIADALHAFSLPRIGDTDRTLLRHLLDDVAVTEAAQAMRGNGADVELCRAQSELLTRLIGDAP